MKILPFRLRPARRSGPNRARRSAATWLGARREPMTSGRGCSRTAEWREKVGDLRRGGRSRERAAQLARRYASERRVRDEQTASVACRVRVRSAGELLGVTTGPGARARSLERQKPRRASGRRRSKPPPDGNELPRGAKPCRRLVPAPVRFSGVLRVRAMARRVTTSDESRGSGRRRERQEGNGRREALRLFGRRKL